MNRRNIILGLTTAAAGSGIVFGSGAFTQVQAERNLTIGVDEDADALLALDAGDNVASVYNSDSAGELVIDTEQLSTDGEGFNAGATAQIGSTNNDLPSPDSATVDNTEADDVAFVVTNNFDTVDGGNDSNDIDVKLDLSNASSGDGTLYFIGTVYPGDTTKVADTGGSQSVTFTLSPDDKIYFAIQIQTDSTTSTNDFDGTVTFTVEPTGS